MKIYVVTTGENAITVSLNGEVAVAKTVKPTLTALGNGRIQFVCDDIDEEVETYRHIFINGQALKGSWIAEEDYLSVALFEAVMNKTFTSSGEASPGGSPYLVASKILTDAQFKALRTTPIEIVVAPGVGKMIKALSWQIYLNVGVAYTGTGSNAYDLQLTYGANETNAVEQTSIGVNAPIREIYSLGSIANSFEYDTVNNKNLTVSSDNSANLTGGDAANTFNVVVQYVIIDMP
jgi:hypothetical protein